MQKSKVTKRKKPGPPATGVRPMIGLRLAVDVTAKIDAYAHKHGLHTRSDAIRHMIDKCLAGCPNQAEA
jgi:hypothetical protein